MLNKYFDKIYLINLDRRTDRIEECDEILGKVNVTYERFSAIDGSTLVPNPKYKLTPNELGCLSSHLAILKEAKSLNLDSVLVLEDDVELCSDFIDKIDDYMNQLPDDWQWLYFGGSHFEEPDKVTENIFRVNKTLTTHAYAIKGEVLDEMINFIESDMSEPIDSKYTLMQKKLVTYVTIPHLIYQRVGYSDIQNKEVDYLGIRHTKMNLGKKK